MSDWYHNARAGEERQPEPGADNPVVLGARLFKNGIDRYTLLFSPGTIQIEGRSAAGWVGRAWRGSGVAMLITAPQSSPQAAADKLSRMIAESWILTEWKAET